MTSTDTLTEVQQHAQEIIALADSLKPSTPPIDTGDALTHALETAADGATLVLAKTLVYPDRLVLGRPVTLQSETYAAAQTTRMTRDEPAPTFQNGIEAYSDQHALLGLALRGTDTIGVLGGRSGVWDRCRLLGDAVQGAHRGVQWSGEASFVRRSYIDNVFRRDQDTQAIAAWDCDGPGLVVDDCYLSAAGQAVMFGGSDSASSARMPRAIRITGSQFTKQAKWIGVQQCKCAFEIKCAIDVTVTGSSFAYGGQSQGQGCFLIVATVRNQDGKAPWSCITNVEIAHCTGELASGVCNFLGTDDTVGKPSGRLDGFNVHDCDFTALDGALGHGRIFTVGMAPAHVTLMNLRVAGVHMNQVGYFYTVTPPTDLVAGGWTMPASEYGLFVDGEVPVYGGKSGRDNLLAYAPGSQLDQTVQ